MHGLQNILNIWYLKQITQIEFNQPRIVTIFHISGYELHPS